MKKLMMLAAAMTIVGSAFADVAVYDYKATIKNVNLKKTTVRIAGTSFVAYVKFIQSTSLYGYLISDCDNCDGIAGNGWGYLVVANKGGDMPKVPKILPADLLVKTWNPKMTQTKTYEAEGYLFAGKGKADWPYAASAAQTQSGVTTWDSGLDYVYTFGSRDAGEGTRFLFGTYNDFERAVVSDQIVTRFFDAWLDASGFGKALTDATDGGCGVGTSCTVLDSLSGSVIGGLFLCFPNEYITSLGPIVREWTLCNAWLGTTDVITGTWSIKRNTKLQPVAETVAEVAYLDAGRPVPLGFGLSTTVVDELVKAAAQAIKPGYSFVDVSAGTSRPAGLVRQQFANAFGLGNP